MQDLALNDEFSVFLDDRHDISTVEGNDAFEQEVVVMLTDYLYDNAIGEVGDENTIKQKIRLQVNRVANENDAIGDIQSIDVVQSETQTDLFEVQIKYIAGEDFEFEVTT